MAYMLLNSESPGAISVPVATAMTRVAVYDVPTGVRAIRIESGTVNGDVVCTVKAPGTIGSQFVPRTSGGENPFLGVAIPRGRVELWGKNSTAAAVDVIIEILA